MESEFPSILISDDHNLEIEIYIQFTKLKFPIIIRKSMENVEKERIKAHKRIIVSKEEDLEKAKTNKKDNSLRKLSNHFKSHTKRFAEDIKCK